MKYKARIREVRFFDLTVDADSLQECSAQVQAYLSRTANLPITGFVGMRFEIESITQGQKNDDPEIKPKPRRKPVPIPKSEGM